MIFHIEHLDFVVQIQFKIFKVAYGNNSEDCILHSFHFVRFVELNLNEILIKEKYSRILGDLAIGILLQLIWASSTSIEILVLKDSVSLFTSHHQR